MAALTFLSELTEPLIWDLQLYSVVRFPFVLLVTPTLGPNSTCTYPQAVTSQTAVCRTNTSGSIKLSIFQLEEPQMLQQEQINLSSMYTSY